VGRQSEKKPPIRILELQELSDERHVRAFGLAFVLAQSIDVALTVAGYIYTAVAGTLGVPFFVHVFDLVYAGIFGALLWLSLRKVLWAIYVRASIGVLFSILSLVGGIVILVLRKTDPLVRMPYEVFPLVLNLGIAVTGFKYASMLNKDQSIRQARIRAESQTTVAE
jgi:hypothetical protein